MRNHDIQLSYLICYDENKRRICREKSTERPESNEEYCKWCYTDGEFVYTKLEELIDFLVEHMSNDNWPKDQARKFFEEQLPKLNHWKFAAKK